MLQRYESTITTLLEYEDVNGGQKFGICYF